MTTLTTLTTRMDGPPQGLRDRLRGGSLDLGLFLLTSLIAAALRWPYLQLIPRLTDETQDMQFALDLAKGSPLPLVSPDAYNGPLVHVLMALGFRLGGGPDWPRMLVWLLGSLTVGLTYLLGLAIGRLAWSGSALRHGSPSGADREGISYAGPFGERGGEVWPRLTGLIAALLVAVAFVPVVVNSHLAWSNSTTPFWTTLFLVVLVEAHRRNAPGWLVMAGLLAGLAQQTHPSALAILVGAGIWLMLVRPAWFRTRWPYLALLVALLAIGNLLIHNLLSGDAVQQASEERDYAFTGGVNLPEYLANLRGFLRLGYQMVTSSFFGGLSEVAEPAALRRLLFAPAVVMYGVLTVLGLVWSARWRDRALPLLCWLAAGLLLPFFNRAYDHFIHARYLAPLLPLASVGLAGLVVAGFRWSEAGLGQRIRPRGEWIAALALLTFLLGYPNSRTQAFYRQEVAAHRTNARLWQTARLLAPLATAEQPIFLDRELRHTRLTAGGNLLLAFDALLELEGVPRRKLKQSEQEELAAGATIVLSGGQRDALAKVLVLEEVGFGEPLAEASPGDYGVYRVVGRR